MRRTIVVGDSRAISHLVAHILSELGYYPVLVANSGQDALEMLSCGDPPALALVDLSDPPMDSVAFTRQAKANSALRDMRIFLITDMPDSAATRLVAHAGADGHICKPFTPEELLSFLISHGLLRLS